MLQIPGAVMAEYWNWQTEHDRTPGPGEGGANLWDFLPRMTKRVPTQRINPPMKNNSN